MRKIYCLNSISQSGLDTFSDMYEFTEDMSMADAILLRSASMHDTLLPDKLLAVARAGAGVNNIPIEDCSAKGIVVFNTPGANANSVKELVIASLLMVARDVLGGIEWIKSYQKGADIASEVEKHKSKFAGNEIKGKSIGVLGLGAIGAEVANACCALGMEVYGYDPYMSVNAAFRLSRKVKPVSELSQIYANCEYISLHMPLSKDNTHMIDEPAIAKMKDGVVVLNFSRDKLVEDEAMLNAIESGKVKRYITDFPNEHTHNKKGVLAIPHLGASTKESEENCAVMAVRQLMDYIDNGNITNSVNFPDCDMGVCRGESRLALLHANQPNMIGQISAVLARYHINIGDMLNKSKDKYAYTLIDLDSIPGAEVEEKLREIKGMKRVRRIHG